MNVFFEILEALCLSFHFALKYKQSWQYLLYMGYVNFLKYISNITMYHFFGRFFSPKTFFMAAPQRKSARELLECTIDCRGKWSVITIDVSFKKTSFLSSLSILVTIIYVGTPPNFRACTGWKLYPRRLKSTFFKKILFVLRSPALRYHPL